MIDISMFSELGFILMSICFVAGFIDAIAGGGGMLTVPAFLMAGLPPHLALGTNKLASSFGSFTSALTYYRKGLFHPKHWWRHTLATAIGAILGTLAADQIPAHLLNTILPLIVIMVALFSLFQRFWPPHFVIGQSHKGSAWTQGLLLGGYDGIAGPGTGAFWTLSNRLLYGLPLISAIGATKLMNFTSNFISLLTFLLLGHVAVTLGVGLGVGLMIGSWCGAQVAMRAPTKLIAVFFNLVVILIAARLVYQNWL